MIFLSISEKSLYVTGVYNLNVIQQSGCLVFNPIMFDNYDAVFNCTPVGLTSDCDGPYLKQFVLVGLDRSFLSVAWLTRIQLVLYFAPDC